MQKYPDCEPPPYSSPGYSSPNHPAPSAPLLDDPTLSPGQPVISTLNYPKPASSQNNDPTSVPIRHVPNTSSNKNSCFREILMDKNHKMKAVIFIIVVILVVGYKIKSPSDATRTKIKSRFITEMRDGSDYYGGFKKIQNDERGFEVSFCDQCNDKCIFGTVRKDHYLNHRYLYPNKTTFLYDYKVCPWKEAMEILTYYNETNSVRYENTFHLDWKWELLGLNLVVNGDQCGTTHHTLTLEFKCGPEFKVLKYYQPNYYLSEGLRIENWWCEKNHGH